MKNYSQWLGGFQNDREAIAAALMGKEAPKDEFTLEIIRKTQTELENSSDPAVRYFAETLTVLPHQPRDATPRVEWLGPEKYQYGEVTTPAGDNLGFIRRRPDGLWNVEPTMSGPIMRAAITKTQTDARCFLAQLLTRPARVIANGKERTLRITAEEGNFFNKTYDHSAWQNEEVGLPKLQDARSIFGTSNTASAREKACNWKCEAQVAREAQTYLKDGDTRRVPEVSISVTDHIATIR